MNQVALVGRLGSDPTKAYTQSGKSVTTLSVGTQGRNDSVEWHRVVCWNQLADNCEKYLVKGQRVAVMGRLQTRAWGDKDGNKRYTTEVIASHVEFLDRPQNKPQQPELPMEGPAPAASPPASDPDPATPSTEDDYDDLPF